MSHEKYIKRKTIPITCKFCGERVFYHTNEYGSKVIFDELGGNWPIHECNGYLLAKSEKESYYFGFLRKLPNSGIQRNGLKMPPKPKTVLIKKEFAWKLV